MQNQMSVPPAVGAQSRNWMDSLAASVRALDLKLGTTYSHLVNRRFVHSVGRLLAALLFAFILIGKWQAVTRLVGTNRIPVDDFTTWSVVINDVLQIPFLGLAVLLVIARRQPRTGTWRFSGLLAALGGTVAPSFLVYQSNAGMHSTLAPLSVVLLLVGMGFAIWSLAALGRCFSVVPEVRGLVTSGPYRWVRHPIYLGEITATLGVLLPIMSVINVAIVLLFCGLQLWRTRYEEAGLAAIFPEYSDYQRRTTRLLPGLW